MTEFRLLSYPMTNDAPVWPGNPPAAQTKAASSIAAGDMANTTVLTLFSHSGTHFDAPKHFNDQVHPVSNWRWSISYFSIPLFWNCRRAMMR